MAAFEGAGDGGDNNLGEGHLEAQSEALHDAEADEGARVPGESGEEGAEGEEGEASHQEVFFVELVSEFAGDDGGDGGGEHAGGNDPRVHGLGTV